MPMPTRARTSRYLPAGVFAALSGRFLPGVLEQPAKLLLSGRIGSVGELRPLEHRMARGLQAIGVTAEVSKAPRTATELLYPCADLVGLHLERMGERSDLLGSAAS